MEAEPILPTYRSNCCPTTLRSTLSCKHIFLSPPRSGLVQSRTVLTRWSSLCLHCARNSGFHLDYVHVRQTRPGGWGGSALRAGSPHTTSGPEPAQNRTSGSEPHKWARTAQVGQNRYYTTTGPFISPDSNHSSRNST